MPKGKKRAVEVPGRKLGRVNDADWQTLKEAAARTGLSFTEWAVTTLMREALQPTVRRL